MREQVNSWYAQHLGPSATTAGQSTATAQACDKPPHQVNILEEVRGVNMAVIDEAGGAGTSGTILQVADGGRRRVQFDGVEVVAGRSNKEKVTPGEGRAAPKLCSQKRRCPIIKL